jgi:hypothetical protein
LSEEVVTERVGAVGLTSTLAIAFFVLSAALVAMTVTLISLVTAGAVTTPVFDTEPALALQVTAVLLVPCTVALNCWRFPEAMRVAVGEIAILMSEFELEKIARRACMLTTAPCASVTRTRKYFVAAIVGLPVMLPLVRFKVNPEGSVPSTRLNV